MDADGSGIKDDNVSGGDGLKTHTPEEGLFTLLLAYLPRELLHLDCCRAECDGSWSRTSPSGKKGPQNQCLEISAVRHP